MSDAPVPSAKAKLDFRPIVIAAILGVALGWFAATSPASPVRPAPERPVLRLLARVAKLGLWALAFAEPPPSQDRHYVVHARVDEDGNRVLHHGEGW